MRNICYNTYDCERSSPFEQGNVELDESYFWHQTGTWDGFKIYDGLVDFGYLKECEFHFNMRNKNMDKYLLKIIKNEPFKLS